MLPSRLAHCRRGILSYSSRAESKELNGARTKPSKVTDDGPRVLKQQARDFGRPSAVSLYCGQRPSVLLNEDLQEHCGSSPPLSRPACSAPLCRARRASVDPPPPITFARPLSLCPPVLSPRVIHERSACLSFWYALNYPLPQPRTSSWSSRAVAGAYCEENHPLSCRALHLFWSLLHQAWLRARAAALRTCTAMEYRRTYGAGRRPSIHMRP